MKPLGEIFARKKNYRENIPGGHGPQSFKSEMAITPWFCVSNGWTFLVSASVVDHGNNLLKVNEFHTAKISFSLLKDGVQDGRRFIIMTIQSTH